MKASDASSATPFDPVTNETASNARGRVPTMPVAIPPHRRTPALTTVLITLLTLTVTDTASLIPLNLLTPDAMGSKGGVRLAEAMGREFSPTSGRSIVPWMLVVVVWLVWNHGIWKDLRTMFPLRQLKYSAPGAVVGYFIPIINLFHAYHVIHSLIVATDPEVLPPVVLERRPIDDESADYREAPPPARVDNVVPPVMVKGWFVLWILSLVSAWITRATENTSLYNLVDVLVVA